jgi:Asp/Glu/hydantoin racemase
VTDERPGILVINPNSNQAVTDGLTRALAPLAVSGGPPIRCLTLTEGPFGIESQADIEAVVEPLRRLVAAQSDAEAFVIACYSDPGLQVCRAATDKPVYGIQESGVRTALAEGARFGVIALGEDSIRRHLVYLRRMGVVERLAGERAADLSVAESAGGEATFQRLCEVGAALRDQDGADVVILGCAGMAAHRDALEARLGIPVIDPTQAAVRMALARRSS